MTMGLSLKLAVVSATVLSTAVMLKLLAPVIMEVAISDLPSLWTSAISWLKPPYLYVVINCIIITIVASSRLQSKLDEYSPPMSTLPAPLLLPTQPLKVVDVLAVELPLVHEPEAAPFHGGKLANEPVKIAAASYSNSPMFVQAPEQSFGTDEYREVEETEANEEITRNRVHKNVTSMSSWTPSNIDQVNLTFPVEKPPASARFSHRKPAKANAEGGRTLGVSKPKRQDTLETTWKTITEGRSVPLTRHLRKSDTWETHGEGRNSDDHPERMTKSDKFDVSGGGGSSRKPPPPPASKLSRSGGSGRLRKEPSLGQEELNRRVEAFIKKFNEDMRLQRQESLNQYMEMINRGAH